MNRKFEIIFLLLIIAIAFNGCYYDVQEELYPEQNTINCDTSNVTYSMKVLPIIQSNCYVCHTGSSPSGNVNLDGYTNLKLFVQNGQLISAITHAPGFAPMPAGGNKLSDCDILIIQNWINNGSINN